MRRAYGTLTEALTAGKPEAGERNLDEAIEAYQAALRYCSPEKEPTVWITAALQLVEVYRKRSEVEKSGDLEDVIAWEDRLLAVMPQDQAPEDWVQLNARLAADYENRNGGSAVENRTKAMRHFAAALEQWKPEISGSAGFGAAEKLAKLANETADPQSREFQSRAVAWMEAFAEFLRHRSKQEARFTVLGIDVLLTHSPFGGDIPWRLLLRVSPEKSTSVPLRF